MTSQSGHKNKTSGWKRVWPLHRDLLIKPKHWPKAILLLRHIQIGAERACVVKVCNMPIAMHCAVNSRQQMLQLNLMQECTTVTSKKILFASIVEIYFFSFKLSFIHLFPKSSTYIEFHYDNNFLFRKWILQMEKES